MVEDVLGAYERFESASDWYGNKSSLEHMRAIEGQVFHKWNHCFNEFIRKQSQSNAAKICDQQTTTIDNFYSNVLGRKNLCIDDIRSVLSNQHKFRVIYTDSDTYLTKDPSFEPKDEESSLGLFDGF